MGWCDNLPVDYSPCNVRAPWDCGLRPASFAGSAPTSAGLQTETGTPSPWDGSGGLRPSAYCPCPPTARWEQPAPARANTPVPGNSLSLPNPPQRGRSARAPDSPPSGPKRAL